MRASFRKSIVPISLLTLIVIVAVPLRLHNVTRQNLWLDEFWALYFATGCGDSIFQLPSNVIISHAPPVQFAGAPPVWHIWNGIASIAHPPLYLMTLRLWVDLLGSTDRSIRLMSALFSIGCVVLLYVAVLKSSGNSWQAIIASGLMAFSPIQIYYSQQARPYTMLQFIALVGGIALISIEKKRATLLYLLGLALAVLALALTHYVSAGLIAGWAIYSLVRLRGQTRYLTASMIAIAILIAAISWGPHLLAYRQTDPTNGYGEIHDRNLAHLVLSIPQRVTLESNQDPLLLSDNGPWPIVVALAIICYAIPLLLVRKRPDLLFWWFWMAGAIAVIFLIDIFRHSTLLSISRLVILAAPGIYALLAVALPGRLGKCIPWVILFGAVACAADYWIAGPPNCPDIQTIANSISREVTPRDVLLITGDYYRAGSQEPPLTYFVLSHYAGPLNCPIVFATAPLSISTRVELTKYPRIWMVGIDPHGDTQKILPGWQVHDIQGPGDSNLLWYVTPPGTSHS
jgi:uncharacterized membrane protein